jgi:hypothetical protein
VLACRGRLSHGPDVATGAANTEAEAPSAAHAQLDLAATALSTAPDAMQAEAAAVPQPAPAAAVEPTPLSPGLARASSRGSQPESSGSVEAPPAAGKDNCSRKRAAPSSEAEDEEDQEGPDWAQQLGLGYLEECTGESYM